MVEEEGKKKSMESKKKHYPYHRQKGIQDLSLAYACDAY